jgi:hypothetical protein
LGNRPTTTEATIIREALIGDAAQIAGLITWLLGCPRSAELGVMADMLSSLFSHFDALPLYCRLIRNT